MTNTVLNYQLIEVIFSLSRTMRDEMKFDSDTSNLSVVQLQALIFIKKKNIVSMSDIAGQFNTTLPTATSLSDKLVRQNLVQRQQGVSDRRVVNLSLTEQGENLLKEAMVQRHQKINNMLFYLSTEDKEQLLKILKNLTAKIQESYEK